MCRALGDQQRKEYLEGITTIKSIKSIIENNKRKLLPFYLFEYIV